MQRDDALELVGQMRAPFRLAAREGLLRPVVGMRQVIDAGQQAAEELAVGGDAAHRDAAEADAVIAALAADEARARALAAHAVIGDRDLERGIDRFGAGIGEEDVVEIARKECREARRRLEHLGMAHLEGRRVVEFERLAVHRLGDLAPRVAGIDAPQPGGAVENAPSVGGGVVHALGRDQQARMRLELAVGGERHPIGFEIIGHDAGARR